MASPGVIAGVGAGANIGGSILSFIGAKREGAATAATYNYQAGIADLNRKIALQNEDYAVTTGDREASNYGIKARQQMGAIRAHQAASGLDVGQGSTVDVQESQEAASKIDIAQIRANAARKAYGYATEAAADEAQANLYRMSASNAKQAGNIKALGSLISGAASVSDKWLQAKSVGLLADKYQPVGA